MELFKMENELQATETKRNNRGYIRAVRRKSIAKKRYILKTIWGNSEEYVTEAAPRLSKQKVHCSCWKCQSKSTKMRVSDHAGTRTIHYNSDKWYKVSDRRHFDSCNEKLKDYYNEVA